jgi:hypothetical protein
MPKVLFIEKGQEEQYCLKQGRFALKPIEYKEGYGLPIEALKNKHYAFAYDKIIILPIAEVTPIETENDD